jgi:hypothetical protein
LLVRFDYSISPPYTESEIASQANYQP